MTLRAFYRDNDGDVVEIENPWRIRVQTVEASSNGEEGSVGTWSVEIDDPDGTFNVRGFRIFYLQEDAAVADDQHGIIGVWYTGDRDVTRGEARTGAGRVWTVNLHDINTRLSWRINVGNDCDRPAETDLERIEWLMGTNEMGSWLDNDTTYIDSSDGRDMDAVDLTGQTLLDVLDDCAQTSGRQYGLLWEYSGSPSDPIAIKLWYKFFDSTDYSSTKLINNVLGEIDSTAVYAPSIDAKLNRSPSRVAWGVYQVYDGGAEYVTLPSTAERFNKIDVTGRGENVKTSGAAIRRANRYLNDVSNVEQDRIEVAVIVVPADVNAALPFMRIQVHFEHLPGYANGADDEYVWMRIAARTVRDISPDFYELSLTLVTDSQDEFPADEGGGSGDETVNPAWQARVEGSSGPYPLPSGPIYWDKSFDQIGLPWWTTVGPFDYADIPDRTWPRYIGIEVTADAFLATISLHAETIGVPLGVNEPYTVTWEILQNDAVIATQSVTGIMAVGASGPVWGGGPVVTAVNITAFAGDVISGRLTCSTPVLEFFRTPRGINAGQNYLTIKGGYLIV